MNDFDLNSKLKSVPVPERTEAYWDKFPSQVRRQLRRPAPPVELHESWLPQFAWSLGASLACLVIGLLVFNQPLKAASNAISQKEKIVRQHLAAIPRQLKVLMTDEHGLNYLVAEKIDLDFMISQLNQTPPGEQTELSAPNILEQLVQQAERAGASDIHLQMRGKSAEVGFRLDGIITPGCELPAEIAERVFGRIKFLARLKTYQETLPQDGRIPRDELKSKNDLRVATYPTVTGEKIVLRLFNSETAKSLGELSLPAAAKAELEKFLRQTSGLLLLTGPAGSGKTTTIYACLRHLAELGGRHIITVEDPVEQVVPGTMQTEVNDAIGLDFARAARHLLRQDPQVLIIGEIRDEATAQLAVRAGLTGHLVISTLHAGSCKGVFERLLAMCADHSAVASAVELVLNQRLIRKVCAACDGAGCESCLRTGYNGRVPLVEWLRVNETLREQIRRRELSGIVSLQTLEASARLLVNQGVTNEVEFKRIFGL